MYTQLARHTDTSEVTLLTAQELTQRLFNYNQVSIQKRSTMLNFKASTGKSKHKAKVQIIKFVHKKILQKQLDTKTKPVSKAAPHRERSRTLSTIYL